MDYFWGPCFGSAMMLWNFTHDLLTSGNKQAAQAGNRT